MAINGLNFKRRQGYLLSNLNIVTHFLTLVLLLNPGESAKQASTIIVESDQGIQGPAIELSASILTDGQSLLWYCRENLLIESNALQRKKLNSIDWDTIAGGVFRGCSNDYLCSVISGRIGWKKSDGGTYRCLAYPEEQFNVIWLNPAVSVSDSAEYEQGEAVEFFCEVEMTPKDINYADIMRVTWHRYNARKFGGSFVPVIEDSNTKLITPNEGSRYSLRISDFSGVRDGGDYKCTADLTGYDQITSSEFKVTSAATSLLKNDKSDTFEFALGEQVVISCLVDSYPYPSEILITIGGKRVDRDSKYTIKTDLYTPVNGKLYSNVTIQNVTADMNDSLVECRVKREGFSDYEGRDQEAMLVFNKIPDDRVFTPPDKDPGGDYAGPGEPQQRTVQTWIIVLAVILSLVIILVVILLYIWKCRTNRESGKDEDDRVYQLSSRVPSNSFQQSHITNPSYDTESSPYRSRDEYQFSERGRDAGPPQLPIKYSRNRAAQPSNNVYSHPVTVHQRY